MAIYLNNTTIKRGNSGIPVGSLSAYTSAANYPSSSTYTYVEDIV